MYSLNKPVRRRNYGWLMLPIIAVGVFAVVYYLAILTLQMATEIALKLWGAK